MFSVSCGVWLHSDRMLCWTPDREVRDLSSKLIHSQSSQNLFSFALQLSGRLHFFFARQKTILVDLYVIIVIMVIFVGQLSDRIKYFVIQNEILLVLTNRPALFVKTA